MRKQRVTNKKIGGVLADKIMQEVCSRSTKLYFPAFGDRAAVWVGDVSMIVRRMIPAKKKRKVKP